MDSNDRNSKDFYFKDDEDKAKALDDMLDASEEEVETLLEQLKQAEKDRDSARELLVDVLKVFYVGEGKVVCPPAVEPVLRTIYTAALSWKKQETTK